MNFRVAYMGNFSPYSTETEIRLAFEMLGWQVVRIQENNCYSSECLDSNPDLFFWTTTHGFNPKGIPMEQVLEVFRQRNVPTAGYHLDTFCGLRELDNREARVGVHPFWKCSVVFTSDGGHQDFFHDRGVNHVWMPPAIGDRHCWLGTPQEEFLCDVAFIGSRHYHPEHSFRPKLVEWLDQRNSFYRVKRWGGDRPGARAELNDIMASAKIVVGDSCFAGSPYTWSDRVTETQGRGGFLVHPASEGMNVAGMGTYKACDLDDLDQTIRYYLANADERERMRLEGFYWTKENHTCSRRVLEILNYLTKTTGKGFN